MQRREFLFEGGRAALGLTLAPMAPWLRGRQSPAEAGDTNVKSLIAELEKEISGLMNKAQVPGLSIALVKDGALLWRRGFGVKDIRLKEPVDDNTVFEAASTSKPVFVYAVMKLCERRVMDLDTPLTTYTPERFLEDDARLDQITARHVLSHTSGLPNWRSKQAPLAIRFTPGEKMGIFRRGLQSPSVGGHSLDRWSRKPAGVRKIRGRRRSVRDGAHDRRVHAGQCSSSVRNDVERFSVDRSHGGQYCLGSRSKGPTPEGE